MREHHCAASKDQTFRECLEEVTVCGAQRAQGSWLPEAELVRKSGKGQRFFQATKGLIEHQNEFLALRWTCLYRADKICILGEPVE